MPTDVELSRQEAKRRRRTVHAWWFAAFVVGFVGRLFVGTWLWWHGRVQAGNAVLLWPFDIHVSSRLAALIPSIVLMGVLVLVLAVPMVGSGRSPHILYRPEDIQTGLDDVVGADTVVEEVRRTLDVFAYHKAFARTGGNPRRGVLFEGPPGTGKTYIAKAIAKEAGVPFLFVSSSAFQSMFYGQTNRKVRAYFRALRRAALRYGGAIGFIEEIDAIGASRSSMRSTGGEGVSGVVNELLVQMQSFDMPSGAVRFYRTLPRWIRGGRGEIRRANVLVVAATNRAQDLDPALLRPGRFDRKISVDAPDRHGRRAIIDYYLARKAHEPELDDEIQRDNLAAATMGYTPVMLEHLLDEALVHAIRRDSVAMNLADVAAARMVEELGLVQSTSYSPTERVRIATHEAGHATVTWLVAPERKMDVLSIARRRSALGLLAHSDVEERFTTTLSEMEHLLLIAMGGMAAEWFLLGEPSNGAAADLASATRLAAMMVGQFGVEGGYTSYSDGPEHTFTARVLSVEPLRDKVDSLLTDAMSQAEDLISRHSHVVVALRDALLERNELIGDEISTLAERSAVQRKSARALDGAAVFDGDGRGPVRASPSLSD